MDRHRERWTEHDLTALADLLAAGHTVREAAHELGRTEEATRLQALRAGLLAKRERS